MTAVLREVGSLGNAEWIFSVRSEICSGFSKLNITRDLVAHTPVQESCLDPIWNYGPLGLLSMLNFLCLLFTLFALCLS